MTKQKQRELAEQKLDEVGGPVCVTCGHRALAHHRSIEFCCYRNCKCREFVLPEAA